MYGPDGDTPKTSKLDPELKSFDTASALWCVVIGAMAFLVLVRRGLRPISS